MLNPASKLFGKKIQDTSSEFSKKNENNRNDSNIEIIDIETAKDQNIHKKHTKKSLETYFENCSVQIGSYGYFNQEKKITLSQKGLTFSIPTLKDDGKIFITYFYLRSNEIK